MTPKSVVIEVQQLRKSYGARLALDCVALDVRAGEVVALLGPNGAGKTTTLSILATLIEPDAGTVRIVGLDTRTHRAAIRRRLGFVPQSIALYPSLTGAQNLQLFLRMHGLDRAAARDACGKALEAVGLADRGDDPIAILSGGMQRRLNLACGLAHQPEVLLLDEPAIGVDPQSRDQILRTIRGLADAGAAAIYSTHYMEEVERLCDRVLLIDKGRVIASGTVAEVIATAGGRPRIEFTFSAEAPAAWYKGIDAIELPHPAGAAGRVALALANVDAVPELLQRARQVAGGLPEFSIRTPNLSDAFMTLTGHSLREGEPD
ncbi:MAG: ABC transporter ATP-binding protein [Deltaproteobacteria bacterium]|nr:ABC transporter ATP-binding protein [Deltaproteobacteria bacterium]